MEAAINSARQITFTIIAMTVSLAVVFLPLVMVTGIIGRIFREFSVTIIVSIFASGIVSITLTPMMCSRVLGPRGEGEPDLDGADRREFLQKISPALMVEVSTFSFITVGFPL